MTFWKWGHVHKWGKISEKLSFSEREITFCREIVKVGTGQNALFVWQNRQAI